MGGSLSQHVISRTSLKFTSGKYAIAFCVFDIMANNSIFAGTATLNLTELSGTVRTLLEFDGKGILRYHSLLLFSENAITRIYNDLIPKELKN